MCYYYIEKYLCVKYLNDDDQSENINITVSKSQNYFSDTESDIENSNRNKDYLKTKNSSKVLFENGKWVKEKYKNRFEDLILNELSAETLIIKIKEKERRYII